MSRVAGFLVRAGIATWLLLPLSVSAASSPSPDLGRILIAPPPGYTASPTATYHGRFTAQDFALTWGSNSATGLSQLSSDGFVDGYGMMWKEAATGRYLAEFIIEFQGGNGATNWLGSEEVENKADSHYQHADSIDGIGTYYYGVHGAQQSPAQVLDGFEFVKGNDMLGVAFWSPKDDVLELARTQTKRQYDAAPVWTIPSAQWPENNRDVGQGPSLADMNQGIIGGLLVIVALLAGGGFWFMRRAERPKPAEVKPEMSPDGQFWWSGSTWVATSEMPPPWAQRSPDGAYWWDGQKWRAVPQNPVSAPAPR
ncbi:MAG TPA: hypothetical protein VJQ08_02560 [Candidatus Dormibacteraeota bacterium]|nr:hypothetical protein [Candidatus Dormibacteraeota bacterium]